KVIRKESKEIKQLVEGGDHSLADRLHAIEQKYMELFQETKRLERDSVKMKKKCDIITRERDVARSDLSKANHQKQKIENLCRELQKENKHVKEESRNITVSEHKKRQELSAKFESTIYEIKAKMESGAFKDGTNSCTHHQSQQEPPSSSSSENSDNSTAKLKSVLEQYRTRDIQYADMLKSMHVEVELWKAKAEQQRQLTNAEGVKVSTLRAQIASFVKTEQELRRQLHTYIEKFRQVEETLIKSNEIFSTFRNEMENMTLKTRKLEEDNATLKNHFEIMNKSLIEVA
ncbi:hypothetical protein HDV05_002987, partial [Chytridiales sp. JEL 0842]